jgi:hypothetical protein
VLVGLAQGIGGLANLFYFLLYYLFSVYFYNTHKVLAGLPQGVGGLVLLFHFISF